MSAEVHELPEPPLPEGWKASSMFEGEWVRLVQPCRPLRDHEVPDTLHVTRTVEGFTAWVGPADIRIERPSATLRDAIAAVERAYCGCRATGFDLDPTAPVTFTNTVGGIGEPLPAPQSADWWSGWKAGMLWAAEMAGDHDDGDEAHDRVLDQLAERVRREAESYSRGPRPPTE